MLQKILEKLNTIDRSLQRLKVDLLLNSKIQKKPPAIYKETDILREARKTRKQVWNENYRFNH